MLVKWLVMPTHNFTRMFVFLLVDYVLICSVKAIYISVKLSHSLFKSY